MKTRKTFWTLFAGILFLFPTIIFSQPNIQINASNLDFGDIVFGETYSAFVLILNTGNDTLNVSSITFTNPDFTADPVSFQVDPGLQQIVEVFFNPSQIAVYNDTMTVISNDPQTPVVIVPVFANVYLPAPQYLSADVTGNDVELSWGTGGGQGDWLFYGDGGINSSLGLSNPAVFRIAARWPASSLVEYVGNPVGKISFVPAGAFSNYTLKIWAGAEADSLIYSQAATNLNIGEFNEVSLTSPVTIQSGTDYWFGVEIDQYIAYDFPATFDFGPAVAGFGDMINLGGEWVSLEQYGWDNNWVLRVFVLNESGSRALSFSAIPEEPLHNLAAKLSGNPEATTHVPKQLRSIELLGYNVYRDGEKLNADLLTQQFFLDENVGTGVFTYGVTSVYDAGESLPIEKVVQVGGPELTLVPDFIYESVEAGTTQTFEINMNNTGSDALEWQVNSLPEWLSLSALAGIIEAGGIQNLEVTVNTAGLGDTIYNTVVNFETNNFSNPVSILPVTIDVQGNDFLVWNVTSADFGMTSLFENKALTVEVTNLLNGLTILYNSFTNSDAFEVYQQSWGLLEGEVGTFVIVFTPEAAQFYQDTLYVDYWNYLGSDTLKLPLTGQGVIPPPSNLSASASADTVTLSWFPPGSSPDELRFGSGLPYGGLYYSDSTTYEMAAKFSPVDLMPYSGKLLQEIGFYLYDVSGANIKLKVYDDENAQNPIINLPLSNLTPEAWNDIELPFPIQIDQLDNLWIGYEAEMLEFVKIAGVDGGPAVNGSGDLIRINGGQWANLAQYEIDRNWNIRGLLADSATGEKLRLTINDQTLKSGIQVNGYNVYKDSVKLNDELITETSFTDLVVPGETYLYGVTAVYDYGESQPAAVIVAAPANLVMPPGWEFQSTDMVHNIQIPSSVAINGFSLQDGDMIGVFYEDEGIEKCAGAVEWNGENLMGLAFGDDPDFPGKNGFALNETLRWKVFFSQSQSNHPLDVTYNHNMPDYNGKFKMFGMSMLESMTLETVDVREYENTNQLVIFPNPSEGIVNISGIDAPGSLRIFDIRGSVVYEMHFESPSLRLERLQEGIYILEMMTNGTVYREKLIIR